MLADSNLAIFSFSLMVGLPALEVTSEPTRASQFICCNIGAHMCLVYEYNKHENWEDKNQEKHKMNKNLNRNRGNLR